MKTANWLKKPFAGFTDYATEIDATLIAVALSIGSVARQYSNDDRNEPTATELASPTMDPEYLQVLKVVGPMAKLIREGGYQNLYTHATIDYWASLEALMEDVLVAYVMKDESVRQNSNFEKIEIRLVDYDGLDATGRARYLIDALRSSRDGTAKSAVEQYESTLSKLKINGPLDSELRRTLIEMQQQRNIIIHNSSIVDRRFVKACPWISVQLGQKRSVTSEDFLRFSTACRQYAWTVHCRFCEHYGLPLPEFKHGIGSLGQNDFNPRRQQ